MARVRRIRWIGSAAAILLTAPAATQSAPADGSLQDLTCKVVATSASRPGTVLFEIEVRNAAARTAEPTVFHVQLGSPPRLHKVERCPLPYADRVGRGIAARGQQRYWLQVASPENPRTLAVEVGEATFRDGEPQSVAPLQLGELRQGTVRYGAISMPATHCEITNRVDLPVDAILLGTFEEPVRGKALLTVRLGPGASTTLDVALQPRELAWRDATGDEGVLLKTLEVVDWTTVDRTTDGEADPTATLAAAYDHWHRWQDPWPSGDGAFRAVYSRSTLRDGAPMVIHGTFTLKDLAPPLVIAAERLDLEPMQALEQALDAAFADLRRPPRATFAQDNRATRADRDRYLVDGPGWSGLFGKLVQLRGDRIVGAADANAPATSYQTWQLLELGDEFVVLGRDTTQLPLGREPMQRERRTYTQHDRWLVPTSYRRDTAYQGFRETIAVQLTFGPLRQRGEPAATPPAGPDVAALRAAWDNGYRYPSATVPLRAKFDLAAPANDPLWLGQRRCRGRFEIAAFAGFAGFLGDGAGLEPSSCTIDGKLDADLQTQLAALVFDRLRAFALRDFAGRAPFDAAVRSAQVRAAPDRPGTFALTGGAIAEVEVQGGLVVRIRWTTGLERAIRWQKCGDVMVPSRIATGDEVVTATWRKIDRDWYLPVELKLERVFGSDLATETLKLTDLALK